MVGGSHMTSAVPTHDADGTPEHGGHRPKDSILDAVPRTESPTEQALPRYSTRGTAPGPRGCWALNKDSMPCGSARRADSDYCNAHSGVGVTSDPKRYSAIGIARNTELRRRRGTLRATLGISRTNTPRGVLKAAVYLEAEKVAMAALDGALAPELPASSRASHALKLIDAVDPLTQVSTTISMPSTPEGVASLSLSQLLSIAEQEQIVIPQSLHRKD